MSNLNTLIREAYANPSRRSEILPRIATEMGRQASLSKQMDSATESAEESVDAQFSMDVKHLPGRWTASVKLGSTKFSVKGKKFDDLLDELVARLESL